MTPEHARAKRRVQEYVRRWQCLVPPGVNVNHRFIEADDDEDATILAETKAQWEYHNATIRWFLPAVCSSTDLYLEQTVVHELCHVLLDPIERHVRGGKMDATCEHTVETVARTLLRTRKARR